MKAHTWNCNTWKSLLVAVLLVLLAVSNEGFAQDRVSGEIKPAPWSGYWWSRKHGMLVKGWSGHYPSPFQRYDSYVESRTGKNPGACAWESDIRNHHYNPNAEGWEGHCNGWAAAAILAPEPRQTVVRNGISFTVADQKGLLCEQYMNTYCNFYGTRYWGPQNNMDDIYPDEFHRLLLEYIASGKSAMVCDTNCDREVWNFPIYKFESHISNGWFNDRKLKVRTQAYFVDDNVSPEYIGTKWTSTTYTYNLFLDQHGNIVGGEWTGGSVRNHPDFVWVPTADAPNPPGTVEENPRIDPRFVREIIFGPSRMDIPRGAPTPDTILREAGLSPNELF